MTELEKARETINKTDEQMARLFEKRMEAVRIIADYKGKNGLPVDDTKREEKIISERSKGIADEAVRDYYVDFLKSNIMLSKKYQHRLLDGVKVAFAGDEGAFAGLCAAKAFPDAKTVSYSDFEKAYKAVENGECDYAFLPIENSVGGDVAKVMDLAFFGSLHINGVYESEIVQNLLCKENVKLSDIKEVISHPQAISQCRNFIEKFEFKTSAADTTSAAARLVSESERNDIAAIASEDAAQKFGLKIIKNHINDENTNTTRFAVFARSDKGFGKNDNRFVMYFTVKNTAGSLGEAISVIGEHGFNLRALKSRPTKELIWDYYFYAEGEGNISGENGKTMLKRLKKCCKRLKIAGSFEREIKL